MFRTQVVRAALRASRIPIAARTTPSLSLSSQRSIHSTSSLRRDEKKDDTEHEGSFAKTDGSIQIEYPEEHDLPSSAPVQGRGGLHFKRTLASFSLEGRVGVVTGGARGLGLVMSQAMVISGADVAIVDLNRFVEEEAEKQALELMESFKRENPGADKVPRVTAHRADVSSEESVQNVIAEIIADHGKIDNLVTSAGFTENFEAINYPIDRVRKLWSVNVDGTYLFAIAVAKHLMERKSPGSMVFIGSMSGAVVNVPQPQAPYNAAKAAVRHLASSLAVEWAHAGIRVNCISPGYMLTALYVSVTEEIFLGILLMVEYRTKKILDDNPDLKKQWTSLIPQGKMGQPEDLMGAVTYLSSDASAYVTGADLRVDGGYTLT
ncbi:D-arabinitol 2-dehydrogenase [ribulose-forming] [Lachnellula suecica]|uniref:D-arabinitol 2-dehydrogenase [ribulose-forming] n=1 Tax=Lachnellula suecica TaxID=602035 RepID=A0A8T9BUN6_9HELO|nr:D-arabinitol 2-dehydrogenase [ribulose-forming] [Lachnellula suecica]